MNKTLLAAALSGILSLALNAETAVSPLPEDSPEATFRSNSPLYKSLMEENRFIVQKYAEHTLESGAWFSHTFNPSHTIVVFMGMLPPSGSNVYQFWVYRKKGAANVASVCTLDGAPHEWEYVGRYEYATVYAPWDFKTIAFDGDKISITINDESRNTVLTFSFDLTQKGGLLEYRAEQE